MSKTLFLKVKIKTLVAESKIIKEEERKALADPKNTTVCDSHGGAPSVYNEKYTELRNHRRGPLREAARHNHLAYGALRGIPYSAMEQKIKEENIPSFTQVKIIFFTFYNGLSAFYAKKGRLHNYLNAYPDAAAAWQAWEDEANAHITQQFE